MMREINHERLMLDRFALLALLRDGGLKSADGRLIAADTEYLILESEYQSLYRTALIARRGNEGVGRLDAVSSLVSKPQEHDWIPVLSPSFLSEILPTPIVVAQPPPEALGLRVRLFMAVEGLSDPEAALVAGLVYFPYPLLACLQDLSRTAIELVAAAEIATIDLQQLRET
jgi:hypothetical protein